MSETERYDVTEDGVNHNNSSGSFVGYSDYAALEQERDRLKDLLKESLEVVKQDIKDIGPCEHDANICVCGLKSLADSIESSLEEKR